MLYYELKNFLKKVFLLLISVIFAFLIINLLLFKISNKQKIPRYLASSVGNYLLTYYPDTYNADSLDNYTAILGDSNAMGSGDAYLNNDYKYSIGHYLNEKYKKNYLNFARPGYGSISAVSNYLKLKKLEKYVIFKKKTKEANEIFFFFYEGNDLDENLKEFELKGRNFEKNITDFVRTRIIENTNIKNKDIINANFPILSFFTSIKNHFINLTKEKNFFNGIIARFRKIFGQTIILANKDLLGDKKEIFWTNETINGNIKNIRPIESAAGSLNVNQKDIGLNIFFESIVFLKSNETESKIKIIYLPSPSICYDWIDPITYYPRYLRGNLKYKKISKIDNLKNSNFIRENIKNFSKENDIEFLDLTSKIQKKTQTNVLHGPLDWIHFNADGYKFIANNL